MTDVAQFKYRAFLSYSHRDKAWGKWLHGALESYRVDRDLVGRETPVGPVPKSLGPIFRDREDFSAGHSLSKQTFAALEASQFLIVLCSPSAAQSHYVNEEVRRFKAANRGDRVIPVIVSGRPGDPERECFPPALRFRLGSDGEITEEADEPIAADAQPEGDGKQIAKQKTIAGLLGLPLDEIVRRMERARKRTNTLWAAIASVLLLLAVAASGSALYAYQKLLESEERLDSAIEIAYGIVGKATEMSDRSGVPVDVTLAFLGQAEAGLNALIARGDNSHLLQYRKALMLLRFADIYSDLGRTDESLRRSVEARNLLQDLVNSDPSKNEWRSSLVDAEMYIGVWLQLGQRLPEALQSYRDGLAAAEELLQHGHANVDLINSISRILVNMGDIQMFQGSSSDAKSSYLQVLNTMVTFANGPEDQDLVTALERQPGLQYMSVEATDRLAYLNTATGAFDKALEYHRQMLTYHEAEANSDSNSISLQSAVEDADIRLGNSLLDVGSIEEALMIFRKGLEIAERLSRSDPGNITHRRSVAVLTDGIGRALLAQGSAIDALNTFQANLRGAEGFILADSANKEWRRNLGIGHERVGDALMAQRDFSAALNEYRAENAIFVELAKNNPDDVETHVWLSKSELKIGEALFNQGKWADAKANFNESLPFFGYRASVDKNIVEYQVFLLETVWRISEVDGNGGQLLNAKLGLEWFNDRKMLTSEHQRWLLKAENDPSLEAEIACFDKDPNRAIVGCKQMIDVVSEDDNRLALAHKVRGDAYRVNSQFDNAIDDFTQAIRFEPNYVIAYNNRGLIYHDMARFDEAIADFNMAIHLEPKFAIAYSNRGIAYESTGKTKEAIADFNDAIRLDPNNVIARDNRGVSYLGLKFFDDAILDFSEAIRLHPEYAIVYIHRSSAFSANGQLDKAIADLNEAIVLEPRSALAYNMRGVAFFQQDQLEQALGDFTEAIRLDPNNAVAYTNRGRVYEREGRFDEAFVEHDAAIRLNPSLAVAYANRGLAYEGKRESDKALIEFERALSIDPQLERAIEGRDRVRASSVTVR